MAKIKCSICSYQFNIWYAGHRPAHILIWFLAFGQGSEACFTLTTGCLGMALQPSAAHYLTKKIELSLAKVLYKSYMYHLTEYIPWYSGYLGLLFQFQFNFTITANTKIQKEKYSNNFWCEKKCRPNASISIEMEDQPFTMKNRSKRKKMTEIKNVPIFGGQLTQVPCTELLRPTHAVYNARTRQNTRTQH